MPLTLGLTETWIKAYVASQVASTFSYEGEYNAATNSPDLDTAPSGITKGDIYMVTTIGTFFTAACGIEDVIIANKTDPTLETDWTIINKGLAIADLIYNRVFTAADEIMVGTGSETHNQVTLGASELIGKKSTGAVTNLTVAETRDILGLLPAKTHTVSATGAQYSTISLALAACAAGDTILLHPGTYTETLTIPENKISIVGVGCPCNTIVTQADAKIIDFGATTGGRIENCKLLLSAPTTAIDMVTGTTGKFKVNKCNSELTCTANLVQADQPTLGHVTGAGILDFNWGKAKYTHSGSTVSGLKAPFKAGPGAKIILYSMKEIEIKGSGSSEVTTTALSVGTGYTIAMKSDIDVDDDTSNATAGMGYVGSATSLLDEYVGNNINVHAADNNAYGAFAFVGSFRSTLNRINVETSGTGKAYSFVESGAGVINSHFDDISAVDGYIGNVNMVSSPIDGKLKVTDSLEIQECAVIPAVNPTLGAVLFVDPADGATKIRGKSGTVTTIAPA